MMAALSLGSCFSDEGAGGDEDDHELLGLSTKKTQPWDILPSFSMAGEEEEGDEGLASSGTLERRSQNGGMADGPSLLPRSSQLSNR